MEGRIKVSSGLIDHILLIQFPIEDMIGGTGTALWLTSPKFVPQVMLSWVLAHEHAHVVRRHNEALTNIETSEIDQKAIEFDADLCAAAEIYRLLQCQYPDPLLDLEVRKYVLFSIFWMLMTLQLQHEQHTHSTPAERLLHVMSKLAIISRSDCADQLPDVAFERVETRQTFELLLQLAIDCEKHRQRLNQGAAHQNLLVQWRMLIDKGGHLDVYRRWDELRGQVGRVSGTCT